MPTRSNALPPGRVRGGWHGAARRNRPPGWWVAHFSRSYHSPSIASIGPAAVDDDMFVHDQSEIEALGSKMSKN